MNRIHSRIICFLLLAMTGASSPIFARGVYQTAEAFLDEVFDQQLPVAKVIWLTGERKKYASEILGHKPAYLRVRYWANEKQSAWILEEIGKTEPITVGFIISEGKIKLLRVLEFRESRGDEVRHGFFTRQFTEAGLKDNGQLDRHIDGITGATLSVRALTRLARLALYLDRLRQQAANPS